MIVGKPKPTHNLNSVIKRDPINRAEYDPYDVGLTTVSERAPIRICHLHL